MLTEAESKVVGQLLELREVRGVIEGRVRRMRRAVIRYICYYFDFIRSIIISVHHYWPRTY